MKARDEIIEKIKIKDVKPAEWNPRVISDRELKKLEDSMSEFGYVEPIIVNKRTGNLVGGHQRFKVLSKKLGLEDEIEAVIVDLSFNQERTLNLALNRISGDWNEDKLYEILEFLKNNESDLLRLTGFDDREIFKFLEKDKEIKEDAFKKAEGTNDVYDVHQGDFYQLGEHKVMCGDGLLMDNWNKLLGTQKADLVFTDPPYNVDLKHRGNRPEEIQEWPDNYDAPVYSVFLDKMCETVRDNLKDGGAFYICQGWAFYHLNILSILKTDGLLYHQCIVWHKMWPVMGRTDYLKDFELVIYGWRKGSKHLFVPGIAGDSDV